MPVLVAHLRAVGVNHEMSGSPGTTAAHRQAGEEQAAGETPDARLVPDTKRVNAINSESASSQSTQVVSLSWQ